jgi:hypothetical protein
LSWSICNKFFKTRTRNNNWKSIKTSSLGDLGGIAISAVRIAGVSHEFSTIPGVREDILKFY